MASSKRSFPHSSLRRRGLANHGALRKGPDGTLLAEAVIAAGRMEVVAAARRIRELAGSADSALDLRIEAILALPHVELIPSTCSKR